ncbi:MAG: DinB family protein [Actinomycetales bacterium]|nr:DinB family protein [Actinomycetales bacterium]
MEHADLELPEKDTKDWTWTVHHRCPECGVAVGDLTVRQVADITDIAARQWVELLERGDAAHLRARPRPRVWSPTEFAAHVRDLGRVFLTRLDLMLAEDTPTFQDWDQDAAALDGDYAHLDPRHVAPAVAVSLGAFAARLREVPLGMEARRGFRSNGSEFTILTLAQYFLHDIVHHLHDVGRPLTV